MKITVSKKDKIISIDLKNEINGNDLNINLTPEDACALAQKILLTLAS